MRQACNEVLSNIPSQSIRSRLEFLLGGFMKLGPGLTFSWKRALGVTKAKRSIAKATGIPTSKTGRRSKVGRWIGMK